jgi:hypothetical protein
MGICTWDAVYSLHAITVLFNGQPMVQQTNFISSDSGEASYIFTLPVGNLPPSTYSISMTMNRSCQEFAMLVTLYNNVNQFGPVSARAGTGGNASVNPYLPISVTTSNGLVVDLLSSGRMFTVNSNQVLRAFVAMNGDLQDAYMSTRSSQLPITVMSWTNTGISWAQTAIELNP